jgi:DNA-binding transcriptional LysR family regulator
MSQPAVTQALAKLEEQVGAQLVERGARGSSLSDNGIVFHRRVRRFLDQAEFAIRELGSASTAAAEQAMLQRMTRSQFRVLIALVEHRSVERASAALGISVPSLLRIAHALEAHLHAKLIERTAEGALMSAAGIRLGRRIKLAVKEIIWGIDEVRASAGASRCEVVIGARPNGGTVLLASVLDEFLRRHPDLSVRIENKSAEQMAEGLATGDVDFVVGLLSDHLGDELVSEPLLSTPYLVAMRKGHALAEKPAVTMSDLLAHKWVIGAIGSSRRDYFERVFAGRRRPPIQIASCAVGVTRQLLMISDRLTLLTSYELEHVGDELAAVPLEMAIPGPSIGITTRAGWLPTIFHDELINTIRTGLAKSVSDAGPLRPDGARPRRRAMPRLVDRKTLPRVARWRH